MQTCDGAAMLPAPFQTLTSSTCRLLRSEDGLTEALLVFFKLTFWLYASSGGRQDTHPWVGDVRTRCGISDFLKGSRQSGACLASAGRSAPGLVVLLKHPPGGF